MEDKTQCHDNAVDQLFERINVLNPAWTTNPLDKVVATHIFRYAFAIPYIGGVCLDLGCGIGLGSFIYSFFCEQVISLDYSDEALLVARENFARPNVEYLKMDLNNEKLSKRLPEKLDSVVGYEILEHLEDPSNCVDQIGNLLEGIGVFSVPINSSTEFHKTVFQSKDEFTQLFQDFQLLEFFYQVGIRFSTQRGGNVFILTCSKSND